MPSTIDVKDATSTTRTVATLDATNALIGEVQASPTANTLLDRLKTIHADLAASLPAGANVVGKFTTDQTTHGTTDLVSADITKVGGAAISQGHGTAAAAIRVELPTDGTGVVGLNTGSNLVGKFGIDQTTPGTTDSVSVKANAYNSAPTVTRAANTTAYSANDVVGGVITFTVIGPTAGNVLITSADLRIDIGSIPSGMTSFRLYLYDTSPASAYADNAAWDLPSGDRANFLGYLDLGTPVDLGSTLFTQLLNPGLQVKLANASTSLYGYLVSAGGFTPAANSEVYNPRLRTVGV